MSQGIELQTPKFNPYFSNMNQTKHCWVAFIDEKACFRQEGEDAPACRRFSRAAASLCPIEWRDRWEEQLEEGTFAGTPQIEA